MKREIILDTETTGLDPRDGHRIVEIGCVELQNAIPTGEIRQYYIYPERDVPPESQAVHGLTNEFLKDKPVFGEIVTDFMDFVAGATLVIHNAEFDLKFLNAEIKPFGYPLYKIQDVVDTLALARKKFPGSPASLDALCRRFEIDNSARDIHGALLDSQLLAEVYLELIGGRQHGMMLDNASPNANDGANLQISGQSPAREKKPYIPPRSFEPDPAEREAHRQMLESLKDPVWEKILQSSGPAQK